MEVGFEYTYKNNSDIIDAIGRIVEFGDLQFTILASIIIFICVGVYYLFPLIYLVKKFSDRQKEKARRTFMLKKIATQREIEDEIESEIEATTQAQAIAKK